MAAIDLIVLGMLIKEDLSAYDIQKLVEYRNISKWVKISTPSIYKKVIQLESKGLIKSKNVKEGNMPEKAIYSITIEGKKEFEKLMVEISMQPIFFYLDLNAVIVNLDSLPFQVQKKCISQIRNNLKIQRAYVEDNICMKENETSIPELGMSVLKQQLNLYQAIEQWVDSLSEKGVNKEPMVR